MYIYHITFSTEAVFKIRHGSLSQTSSASNIQYMMRDEWRSANLLEDQFLRVDLKHPSSWRGLLSWFDLRYIQLGTPQIPPAKKQNSWGGRFSSGCRLPVAVVGPPPSAEVPPLVKAMLGCDTRL